MPESVIDFSYDIVWSWLCGDGNLVGGWFTQPHKQAYRQTRRRQDDLRSASRRLIFITIEARMRAVEGTVLYIK